MPLLSVKVFDNRNREVQSTFAVSNYLQTPLRVPLLRKLVLDEARAIICDNQLIGLRFTINDWILVAAATRNCSIQELELFLELLDKSLIKSNIPKYSTISAKDFQELCNSLIEKVEKTRKELKITLLGLDRSGKSTFIKSMTEDQPLAGFKSYESTQLLDIVKIKRIGDLPPIQFFDLGYAFQQHWWRFSSESDGYIYFIDTTDTNRINDAKELFLEIRNFWDLPFVIAANKRDTSRLTHVRKYLSRKLQVSSKIIYEINTSTGSGIQSLLEGLVKNEMQEKQILVPVVPKSKNSG
ncbi:MAG: hypothetical protein JSV04_12710 [Candidatus Heimdallarchaeota archaeon]|nr:MAG: hypothetical protein JSV04_12710 [Candidatus Heimdallarchaeota archaeon]